MGTVFAECWKCDQCAHKWLKGEIYPSHCAKCRSRKWDSAKLAQQLEASLAETPEPSMAAGKSSEEGCPSVRNREAAPKPSIQELRDICAGNLPEAKAELHPEYEAIWCKYTEYDPESGETMACGLAHHSMKQKHGNWRKA